MGGFGSGRWGGGPTVEAGLRLDINDLLQKKIIVPWGLRSGLLRWTNSATGEQIASMGFDAYLVHGDGARARLRYSVDGVAQDYWVQITTSPCNYGGVRWWWRCPLSGRRAAKLYLPPGASIFACRNAYRLAYQSQRMTALDRSYERQRRLHRKLGIECEGFDELPPPRPKGMHRKTFARLTAELGEAVWLHDRLFVAVAAPLIARASRSMRESEEMCFLARA